MARKGITFVILLCAQVQMQVCTSTDESLESCAEDSGRKTRSESLIQSRAKAQKRLDNELEESGASSSTSFRRRRSRRRGKPPPTTTPPPAPCQTVDDFPPRFLCVEHADGRMDGTYEVDDNTNRETSGNFGRDGVPRYLKCTDEYDSIQRKPKSTFDPAPQWQISFGNTRFYSIYSSCDIPPVSGWSKNLYSSVSRGTGSNLTVTLGPCADTTGCSVATTESTASTITNAIITTTTTTAAAATPAASTTTQDWCSEFDPTQKMNFITGTCQNLINAHSDGCFAVHPDLCERGCQSAVEKLCECGEENLKNFACPIAHCCQGVTR